MDSDSDKTRMIRRPSSGQSQPQDHGATRIIRPGEKRVEVGGSAHTGTDVDADADKDDATRLIKRSHQPPPMDSGENSDKTQLVRRASKEGEVSASTGSGSTEDDPITGWLVVISGPGKGSQIALGEQDNRVGRGGGSDDPRVFLTFGDQGISRSNAFVLRYDPKKRRFKLLPGGGTNIIYLNGEDLDGPTVLKSGDVIELSETKLRFVPFCGSDFDWADTSH